jgi:hypothetical protein
VEDRETPLLDGIRPPLAAVLHATFFFFPLFYLFKSR